MNDTLFAVIVILTTIVAFGIPIFIVLRFIKPLLNKYYDSPAFKNSIKNNKNVYTWKHSMLIGVLYGIGYLVYKMITDGSNPSLNWVWEIIGFFIAIIIFIWGFMKYVIMFIFGAWLIAQFIKLILYFLNSHNDY